MKCAGQEQLLPYCKTLVFGGYFFGDIGAQGKEPHNVSPPILYAELYWGSDEMENLISSWDIFFTIHETRWGDS